METARLFGIPVARITETEALERIVALAKERKGLGRPAQVATLNVDFVANAVASWPFRGDAELWDTLRKADLVTADGMPIVLLSRLLRQPLPERVTGADLVPRLCRRCAEEGMSVYILGGSQPALDEALAKLGAEGYGAADPDNGARPRLKVAGIDTAKVDLSADPAETVARIDAAAPDILFVALGNPKQELWMGRFGRNLRAGVMIGIGGTFNFIAGSVSRAPRWMQRCGMEWIYRIIQEPGRLWKRYAYGLVKFSWLSLGAILGKKY